MLGCVNVNENANAIHQIGENVNIQHNIQCPLLSSYNFHVFRKRMISRMGMWAMFAFFHPVCIHKTTS